MKPHDLEEEIRALHQKGDLLKAFERAIRAYGPWLKGWLLRRVRDEQRALDIYQETCLKAWRGLPGFLWESRLKTWLCTIALRELLKSPHYSEERRLPSHEWEKLSPRISSLATRLDKRDQLAALFSRFSEEEQ